MAYVKLRPGVIRTNLAWRRISRAVSSVSNDIDMRRKRAAYRAAHRGTKEMDLVLGKFAELRLPEMAEADLAAFEALLLVPDPDLQDFVWGARAAPAEHAPLIEAIRVFHRLDAKLGA